jgi:hypothetical protein
MMVRLEEYAPGRWRVEKRRIGGARSNLSLPYVISDEMPPTEHVDGRHYTSKAAFRATTRAHGLTEVGNDKPPPKQRSTDAKTVKAARREALKTATEKYRAGHRSR